MVTRPHLHPRRPALATALAALLLVALGLSAAVAAPVDAVTPDTYFFISSFGPTYATGDYYGEFGAGPNGIATDDNGNVYVTIPQGFVKYYSNGNIACVYKGDNDYVAGHSYGLDVDSNGNVYYADRDNHWIVKLHPDSNGLQGNVYRWVSVTGKNAASYFGGAAGGDANIGTGDGEFNFPNDVAVDGHYLYVTDLDNNRVQKFDTATNDNSLSFVTKWGKDGGAGGPSSYGSGNGEFNAPRGIAVDSSHNVYVAEAANDRVQVFTSAGVYVKKFGSSTSSDPLYFYQPIGLDVGTDGCVYVADSINLTSWVGKFRPSGSTYTLAERTGGWGSGDAQFMNPWAPAVAPNGYLYVTDTMNHKVKKFARDATPPTVSALRVPLGWVKTIDWWELRATDPTVDGQYTSGGVHISYSKTGGAPWLEYLEPFVSLDFHEGDNTVTYFATDAAGNASTPAAVHVYWDKTAPVTTASGASAGWTKVAQTITLEPDNDGLSPIGSTQCRLQGAANWTTYAAPFVVSADGDHTYEFRSTDSAGNVETPKTVRVMVDGTAPVTTVSGLTGGWTNAIDRVSFASTDGASGVASTQWSTDAGAHWSSGPLAGAFPEGAIPVQFRSTDFAGNVEAVKTATISYDLSRPVPTALVNKSVRRLKTVKLPYKITDVTPQAKVTIKIYKGTRLKTTLNAGFKATGVNLTYRYKCKLAKGKYTWKVFATDLAGNRQVKPAIKKLTVK